MPTAKADLYLNENGKATTEKTDTPYLQTGAVISAKEAERVDLANAYKKTDGEESLPETPGTVGLPQSPDAGGNVLTAPAVGVEETAIESVVEAVAPEDEATPAPLRKRTKK